MLSDATASVPAGRHAIRVGHHMYPIVGPSIRDPRLHLAAVIITIHVLGQVAFDFHVSIPQIVTAIVTCALIEVVHVARRDRRIAWPASAMLTGSGIGLILRVVGTEPNDHWTFDGWYWFAGVAALAMFTKYVVRWRGGHVFNPSNVALVTAFLVFGSDRIEPLDFWWGPFDAALALAYVVILTGGIVITRRLGLLEMGVAYWLTFAGGTAVLAWFGHAITTRWSLEPVTGGHFWWVVVTSPEILIFLFFMLTDPRTVPDGRVARVLFGVSVGALATLLLAPQQTEFGAKVAVLGALTLMCPMRYLMADRLPAAGSTSDQPGEALARVFGTDALGRRWRGATAVVRAAGVGLLVSFVVLAAGMHARSSPSPVPTDTLDASDSVPCERDRPMPDLERTHELSTIQGAPDAEDSHEMVLAFLCALDVEAMAMQQREPDLLVGVDHGARLEQMRQSIESGDEIIVVTYEIDALSASAVRRSGQSAPVIGLTAVGRATETTYDTSGRSLRSTTRAVNELFSLRRFGTDEWRIVEVT